jgi:hypothetical protein
MYCVISFPADCFDIFILVLIIFAKIQFFLQFFSAFLKSQIFVSNYPPAVGLLLTTWWRLGEVAASTELAAG